MAEKQEISQLPDLSKLSHKQRKAYLKKVKRKAKRQVEAKKRDAALGPEDQDDIFVPTQRQIYEEEYKRKREQELREYAHQQWLEKERLAQLAFKAKKEWEEKEKIRLKEQEQKIREEWEEREKREKEEEEKRTKAEEERKTKQVMKKTTIRSKLSIDEHLHADKLLKEATAHENKDDGTWHNPLAPVRYGKERAVEKCPFFMKTGACRFAERCSRAHDHPDSSQTILFPGMYAHFSLENALRDEYDTDIDLEYEDQDTYHHFEEFYNDVLPEFKKIGKVIQFKVCRNYEPHLRGNVYVQFENEADAMTAYQSFNARWYGGRQLQCEFCSVTNWKSAICGLYERKRCPKGKGCNFLHVFQNPNREFFDADRGFNSQSERSQNFSQRGGNYSRGRYSRSRSRSRDRDHSRSHDARDYSRSRETREFSKSHDPRDYSRSRQTRDYSRSRDIDLVSREQYDRGSSMRSDRQRSRSRERYRSRSSRYRSRSRERDRERSRERHRSRSDSRDRHRLRSKDRHESKSKDRRPSKARSARDDHRTDSKSRDSSVTCAKNALNNDYWSSSRTDFEHDSVYGNDNVKNGKSDKLYAHSEQDSDSSLESSVTNRSDFSKRHKKHKKHKKHKRHHSRERVEGETV